MIRSTVLLGFLCLLLAAGVRADTRFSFEMPGPDHAIVLEASVLNGSLVIEPGDGNQVEVILDHDGEALAVKEEPGMWTVSAVGMTVETLENRAVLKTRLARPLSVRLRVPQRAMLKLQTAMGGDLTLSGMQGAIEIKANNSNVTATGVSSAIVVSSIEGLIDVDFASVDVASAASLVTWSGDVRVSLPSTLGVDLRVKAVRGEVDSDVPLAAPASGGSNPRQKAELRGRVGQRGTHAPVGVLLRQADPADSLTPATC